ncbi:hypothetical protein [Methanosarcina acetivorans]|nr:hypothetical protein [Methanosarcina acetivorans]
MTLDRILDVVRDMTRNATSDMTREILAFWFFFNFASDLKA